MANQIQSQNPTKIPLLSLLLQCLLISPAKSTTINVMGQGAWPDGHSDSTAAFLKAWGLACYASAGRAATIYVPRGEYVIQPVSFTGPCRNRVTVWMDRKARLVAPADYKGLAKSEYWILFYKVNGIRVYGGALDARGSKFWACRRRGGCSGGARTLSFVWCTDVEVGDVSTVNSQSMHVAVVSSRRVVLERLHISAPGNSPNTDSIHLQSSNSVTISSTAIHTGDDCISIGPGNKDVYIRRIACGPGHGISIGSLGNTLHEEGVENVTVTGAVFWNTQNGVRIKSWGRPSTSYVRNVVFRNLIMRNVFNPIIIDQRYCPGNQCPTQHSGVRVSGVKYKNIRGTSASKVAVSFECSPSNPCKGIKLQDIKLTYMNKPALSTCSYAKGSTRGTVIPRGCW